MIGNELERRMGMWIDVNDSNNAKGCRRAASKNGEDDVDSRRTAGAQV